MRRGAASTPCCGSTRRRRRSRAGSGASTTAADANRRREKSPAEILWRTEFHAEPKKAKLDLASLSEVFRQLAESADARVRDLRYLVTLLLLRHRKLRVARTRSGENQDFLVVSFGRAKQTFDIEVSELPGAPRGAPRAAAGGLRRGRRARERREWRGGGENSDRREGAEPRVAAPQKSRAAPRRDCKNGACVFRPPR